ncbi:MAG: MotA/TolQ/ExbB proton channel family protein [Pseudomonadales bacterium]
MTTLQRTGANLVLRAFIIAGLIGFGFFIAIERGLVQLALDSDKSYISYVILGIYLLASGHWIWLAQKLSTEQQQFAILESAVKDGQALTDLQTEAQSNATAPSGSIRRFRESLAYKGNAKDAEVLVEAVGDEIANGHAFGHFLSDVLLRLGLLGTIVGFIFMLLPIAEMQGIDASTMQKLLTSMSGGMAVALYTTLAGLITSTLLKLQYHILDASAAQLVTRLAVLVDARLQPASQAALKRAAG